MIIESARDYGTDLILGSFQVFVSVLEGLCCGKRTEYYRCMKLDFIPIRRYAYLVSEVIYQVCNNFFSNNNPASEVGTCFMKLKSK